MSYVDFPISRCEAARAMVLTDQTQRQCACEHDCPPDRRCPLAGCFADELAVLADETVRSRLDAAGTA